MILLVVGILLILVFWGAIFRRWQRGIYLLLVYLPFAGVVTILLYPSPLPTLFKDIFFVLPAYISFFLLWMVSRAKVNVYLPKLVSAALLGLTALVFVHMFNPNVANWLVAAIGAKVWLFYIPLIIMVPVMVKHNGDLIKMFRIMVAIAWIPCAVGIIQLIGSRIFGYETTMQAFFGEAAAGATQSFARFDLGGYLYRIPSTFTFVSQYYGYTLAMVVPAFALMRMDPSKKWRKFSRFILWLVITASFLSGARAAFVFIPLLLALIYTFEGDLKGLARAVVLIPVFLLVALGIAGIDSGVLFDHMRGLIPEHTLGMSNLYLQAFNQAPLGMGTGMNTGPARYAFADQQGLAALEGYFVKALYELGIPGFFIVAALIILLMVYGYKAHQRIHDRKLRGCSAALLAFIITIAVDSYKAGRIDLDPINVYFWMFAGLLLKLGYLDKLSQASPKVRQTTVKTHRGFSAGRPYPT